VKPKVAPIDAGYALSIENVPSAIVASDMAFASAGATDTAHPASACS
jgi:hypothetical protein